MVDQALLQHQIFKLTQAAAGDGGQRPGDEGSVSMLAIDIGMDVLLGHLEVLRKIATQTGGVQNGAGADDLVLRNAGELTESIGHHVHRIADDDIQGIRSHGGNLGSDLLENIYIGLSQIQTGLAGLAAHAGSDDHDLGVPSILIGSCDDGNGFPETGALNDVHNLAFQFILIDVNKNDIRSRIPLGESVCNGGANITCADHSNFTSHSHVSFQVFAKG